MEFTVIDPIKQKDGTWDLVEYTEEREFPESEGRHSNLCVVCAFPSYPECREWCPHQGFNSDKS